MTQRHLRDLYVRGTLVNMVDEGGTALPEDDPEGGPPSASVFVKKLNTAESAEAVRMASAARATVLAARKDESSDLFISAVDEIDGMTREEIVDFLISEDLSKKTDSIKAEEASEDEWSKDDYLQGLNDAWDGGLGEVWLKTATAEEGTEPLAQAEEAARVYAELKRFQDRITTQITSTADYLRRDYEDVSMEVMQPKAVQRLIKVRGDIAWLDEYRKAEVYLATRDPENHRVKYFETRAEVDELELPILLNLLRTLSELAVDAQEGKDLQATPAS